MGLLDSLLGSPTPPKDPDTDPTIDLPEDEYTIAYPVAIHRADLEAFTAVIKAAEEAPPIQGPAADIITESVDRATKQATPDQQSLSEIRERDREQAQEIISFWTESLQTDPDVIFVPVGAQHPLRRMLDICVQRGDSEADPFTLPDAFVDAVSFFKKLRTAEEQKTPVLVHQDQIPPVL